MKKYIVLLLTFIMMFALCACNNEPVSNGTIPSETTEMVLDTKPVDTVATQPQATNKDVNTIAVPGRSIYVDYSASWRYKEQSRTTLMYGSNDMLVGLCFNIKDEYTGDLEGVIELFKTKFLNDASTSSRGDLYMSEIVVSDTEQVKVAGFDSVRFTGTALNDDEWECHVYGYTFIIDGVPCAVIGIVSAESQDPAMIAEMNTAVDEIASTIRTTE